MAPDRAPRGFDHFHTDEELLAYAERTPEQKMRWLHAVWRFTADFLPVETREAWRRLRDGSL
jgi:hypothetical protein